MKKKILGLFLLGLFMLCNLSYAGLYTGVMKGTIKGAEVTYKDADEITVRAGFGDCNGNYWELTADTDVDIYSALPSGEDFVYIYVDDSASSYPTPTIIGDVTEPAWSNAKMGWYNGDDRCIGVVWSPSTGRDILEYSLSAESLYSFKTVLKQVLNDGNPTGSWIMAESTAYIPINASAVNVGLFAVDQNNTLRAQVGVYETHTTTYAGDFGYHQSTDVQLLPIARGSSRDLMWKGDDDDDNYFDVNIVGYKIER